MNLFNKLDNEIESYLSKNKSIIVPLGSIERHNNLPSSTDFLIADKISEDLSERLGIPKIHTIPVGLSLYPHNKYSSTISLHAETLIKLLTDILESLYLHGFRKIILINSHGFNEFCIKIVTQELSYKYKDIGIIKKNWWDPLETRKLILEPYEKLEDIQCEETLIISEIFSKEFIKGVEKNEKFYSKSLKIASKLNINIKKDKEDLLGLANKFYKEIIKNLIRDLK